MNTDFSDEIVLRNTARVLRSTVLPSVSDEAVRLTVIQMIAVIEKHLMARRDDHDDVGVLSELEFLEHQLSTDIGQLAAFRGRLMDAPDAC